MNGNGSAVDHALMALCHRMEPALTTDTTRASLLNTLLQEAMDPMADTTMKAAE